MKRSIIRFFIIVLIIYVLNEIHNQKELERQAKEKSAQCVEQLMNDVLGESGSLLEKVDE